ncbi:nucleolar protein 8 [Hyla sarda]|uniref:nucleolar protein 8 n=1 Tax=Hyla sarda TaxID=327740 RepID=UPI0024C244F2|nr:nucleolar protein 8 [Hyla sarda]XP_056380003.1 nucleolar protein 8 [Hyla sarda]XP_056380005.1 nucleolar protein 8 [Hyla sarda]XP_056380006.1 nucleolar protein 8 [Hyla sarda]XP_056380007.1 nucleolar protein 8 [Hyla sarda]
METTLRRLYVGGIGPSVTDEELSERFGRFGKVDEVDIISRKDDQGNPIKTFAYLNINISDADLKKCISLLNKTKWKGGVLQIETAKESFLHKLEQERQAAKEKKKPKEQSHPQNDLLQSLEKSGVTDFQMKAAVPGTEVPNHKNWVVSKYGRVLPVLHLKGNKQSKIMKCDPSKYCHNIKRLDVSLESTPVSQLTWHLDGGDDDISKKRRGEFPEYKSPVKKSKLNSYLRSSKSDEKGQSVRTPQTTLQRANDVLVAQHKRDNFKEKSRGYVGNRSMNSMSDGEYDSEEELKVIIEREKIVQESGRHSDDNNIEVVDDSFTPKYKTHWAEEIPKRSSTKDDNEYDSADTDEIITVAKTTKNCRNDKKEKARNGNVVSSDLNISKCNVKRKDEENGTEEESQSNDSETEGGSDSYSDEEYESMMQNCYRLDLSMGDLEALAKEAGQSGSENTDESNGSDQEDDSADDIAKTCDSVGDLKRSDGDQTTKKKKKSKAAPAGDLGAVICNNKNSESSSSHSEHESGSMKQDLKSLEKSVSKQSSNIDDGTDVRSKDEKAATKTQKEAKNNNENAAVLRNQKRKKGIEPDDIVTSILEDKDDDDRSHNQRKRKKKKNPSNLPPAFKGLGSLTPLSDSSETKAGSSSVSCGQPTTAVGVSSKSNVNSTPSESKVKQDSKNSGQMPPKPVKKTSTNIQQTSEDDDGGSSSSSEESSTDDESSSAPSPVAKPKVSLQSSTKEQPISKAKQLKDNQKRLAAMEERRKEREQQKRTIQGALLKLDSQSANKSQHIVFNSESEEESEKEEEASTSNVQSDNMVTPAKSKLFDSSGEDSDDEEEKDDERFEIKTQYEGRSGAKLMQLQSRFRTDERFKMDARFLEDSSEDEEEAEQPQNLQMDEDGLSAEKKRNLDILQSVLNINVAPQPASKKAAKTKKFKDLNALQYDPTKEDHAVFETKAEEEKKESKSEIKKKRLEAEKLPEVSKELFHEVTADLKDVFGAPKPQVTEEPEITWDQMEKPQKMEAESSMADVDLSFQKKEESAGFTFSFFGTSTEESILQDEPYKIETIKPAKVAWQENPRFQDSSSEGEEEEDTPVNTGSQLQKNSSIRFFFFVKDDTRLKEGPRMFFRSAESQQKAKEWDYMRDTIMEECRKRHRDAKRKLKSRR